MDCPALRFSARPPPGRRDSPGPGGRHRGQVHHGKQIPQPTASHQRRPDLPTEESMFLNAEKCMYVVVMAYRGRKDI